MYQTLRAPTTMAPTSGFRQPLVKPVHFSSVNLVAPPSANIRWASADAVNFMDHLYYLTNMVLDYLLEDQLPKELMNQTLLDDPVPVLMEHRAELITHFHRILIAACVCLCIGISIPLFGFMIACCWCNGSSKSTRSAAKRTNEQARSRSHNRPHSSSRSRSHHRESSDADWLALTARDSGSQSEQARSDQSSARHQRELERRRRNGRGQRRATGNNGVLSSNQPSHYRSRSMPPSLKYESSCHPCLRTLFSSNLFIMLLLIAFFAVCAFVTNEYVNNGVKQLPRAINQSVDDIQTYLNNTDHEVDNLLRVNFNQLETEIGSRLDSGGAIIRHKLAVSSGAIAVVNLTQIVQELNDTKTRLERLDKELSNLKSNINTAKRGLEEFRETIENCPPDQCSILRRKYQNLDNFRVLPQYEKLPDVKNLIRKVTQLIDSGIVGQVQDGKNELFEYGTLIQSELNARIPDIKSQLSLMGKRLSSIANEVSQSIRWSDQFFNQTRSNAKRLTQISDYEQYRRYACLAGASVILFILLCYTLGWLFGSCRPQPTPRTYKTHLRTSASASFPFSCGIFVVFLLFLPMILGAIVLFISGSVGDKIVCSVIKRPEEKQSKQIYAMLQNKFLGSDLSISAPDQERVVIEFIDGKEYKVYRPNFADLVARCHRNQSIYKIFRLDQYDKVYLKDDSNSSLIAVGKGTTKITLGLSIKNFYSNGMPEFRKTGIIDSRLKELIKNVQIDTNRITLLSSRAERVLRESNSLSFDDIESSFSKLYDNGISISPIDIEQFIRDLHAQKGALKEVGSDPMDADSHLNIAVIFAQSFTEKLLPNITSSLLSLREGVRHLKVRMFHGRQSFGVVVNELVAKIREAEQNLRDNGTTLIRDSATEFSGELNALLDQYSNHVRYQVENVIGQCEPVSRAINSTTTTFCDDIILPFNGYWLSAVASLILILPATLLAYDLKGLYRLARRYPQVPHHRNDYSYTDQEDLSYDDDGEEIALAYYLGRHSQMAPHKPSGSAPLPSAPVARDEGGWSPTSSSYIQNSRPPPYAV